MMPPRNFSTFLETYDEADSDFVERLKKAKADIVSVNQLIRFARDRWPSDFSSDSRISTENMAHGKEAMRRLWGVYLNWLETGA
jgi:hypothetical protein